MNEQSVQSVQGQGNTIPGPNRRPLVQSASNRWCFTLNNWTEEEYVQIVQSFSQGGHNYVIGKEVGENGTPHLQGYVEVKDKKRVRWTCFRLSERIHWEKCKGDRASNVRYCSKENDYEHSSELKPEKPRRELVKMEYSFLNEKQRKIADRFTNFEDPLWGRYIYWFWESEGNWGKSVLATYLIDQCGAIEVGCGS